MTTQSTTPRTDEAVSRIEKKHTHSHAFRVAINYKAAFIELGFEMADFEADRAALEGCVKALKPFAAFPFDALLQGQRHPDEIVYSINGQGITGTDILNARAALAAADGKQPAASQGAGSGGEG